MAKINMNQILVKSSKAFTKPTIRKQFASTAQNKVDKSKKDFLNLDFDTDPTNVELENSDNGIGEGEIYGYLGFIQGSDPVSDTRAKTDQNIKITNQKQVKSTKGAKTAYEFTVNYPDEDIVGQSLPWISRNWIDALQRGIGNIERTIFKEDAGRSKKAIQANGSVSNKSEPTVPTYWENLREKYFERLKRRGD